MWLIYFTIILAVSYPIVAGLVHDDTYASNKTFIRRTESYFRKRCYANANENQLEDVLKELQSIVKCFLKTFPKNLSENEEELEEQCLEKRQEVIKCLERLMDMVAPCLPPEESYLPQFFVKSYKGYSDYFCHHIKILTFEGMLESNLMKCVNRFIRHEEYSPQHVCYESLKFSNHSDTSPISKDELCRDLDDIYKCTERQFKEHCPDSPKGWEFEAGLINGIRSPCKED